MSVKRTVSLHLQLLHDYVHMDATVKGTDLEISITLLLHSVANIPDCELKKNQVQADTVT